jgi:hypothetical protein
MLMTTKGACDLYIARRDRILVSQRASGFQHALSSGITLQDNVYKQMSQKGWYSTTQADQQQVSQVRQKFPASF